MMDTSRKNNSQFGIYFLAFALALFIRLLRLGELPLGDVEAAWAMRALDVSRGLNPVLGVQPAYVNLTGLAFFLFQASNFTARLVPALFGAFLCLLPFKFRDILGSKPAFVMAFLLALDPGFLATSRLAGSPILAVTTFLLAWSAWRSRNYPVAGVWVGIALLSGPSLWAGLLGLVLASGLQRVLPVSNEDEDYAADGDQVSIELANPGRAIPDGKTWMSLVAYALGSYVLVGSLFLLVSGGLGSGLAAIPAYFSSWFAPINENLTSIPVTQLLLALLGYESPLLAVGVVALVRGIIVRDGRVMRLGLWLITALVLTFANPSRQVMDLIWVLIPMIGLAAVEISHHLSSAEEGTWETYGMAIFTSSILIFMMLNFAAIALVPMDPAALQLRWWILVGSLALLIISIAMVGFGWSPSIALQGSAWGTLIVLFVLMLSAATASGGLRTYRTFELWPQGTFPGQVSTLVDQMNDLSRWHEGVNTVLDVTIAGVDSPALLWALRDWHPAVLPDVNLSGSAPSVVIASDQFSSTEIESTYRGQDLSWRVTPLWTQGLLTDWLKWSLMHEFPTRDEKIILWVRSDVFIDAQNGK
jgi:hypothetical protein